MREGSPPHEVRLVQVDEPAEAQLEGRVLLLRGEGITNTGELGADKDQPGFDAEHVQCGGADRPKAEVRTNLEQGIPEVDRPRRLDPQFVAEIARVARAGHVDGDLAYGRGASAEILQAAPVLSRNRLEHGPRRRPLEGQRSDLPGDVIDSNVQPARVQAEPPVVGLRSRPPERRLFQTAHGAVVDELAALVAPGRVVDLIDLKLAGVSRDDAVDQPDRVGPGDQVLEQRRHVDEPGRLANGVVLDVDRIGVLADGVIAPPVLPRPLLG